MSIAEFFIAFFFGIACAIISVCTIVVMAKEPILNWWFRLGNFVGIKVRSGMEVERWFFRPIWGCEKCFAGQLALWLYLWFTFDDYNFFFHVLTICTAILSAVFISHLITKIEQHADTPTG